MLPSASIAIAIVNAIFMVAPFCAAVRWARAGSSLLAS
jgi:hypothetical protein